MRLCFVLAYVLVAISSSSEAETCEANRCGEVLLDERRNKFLRSLREVPLVASVQASPGSPLAEVDILVSLARASADQGVKVLRAEGVEAIQAISKATGCSMICLIKRDYTDSHVRITPTLVEVDALLELPECDVIALDATLRRRPGDVKLDELIQRAHSASRLVLADADGLDGMRHAARLGADMLSTTLAGYTAAASMQKRAVDGPAIELVRRAAAELSVPVIAEGRISSADHVLVALRAGAIAAVVGGALNDPVKNTRQLLKGALPRAIGCEVGDGALVGAFDLGGTWLRYGVFSSHWKLQRKHKIAMPKTREERAHWMQERVKEDNVSCIGISTGGVVDPISGVITSAKEDVIPDFVGFDFPSVLSPLPVVALNDGLATAWAHACVPEFAGLRVATLALGTGVGCGFVDERMHLWTGPGGAYPRLNDLLSPVVTPSGDVTTFENLMGGLHLSGNTEKESSLKRAKAAAQAALATVVALWLPDVVVMAGGVGLGANLIEMNTTYDVPGSSAEPVRVVPSPLDTEAGLYAAAALALFYPRMMV